VIDADTAPVVFTSRTVPADDAIRTVAAVDGASVQFYVPIDGNVTLSSARLSAPEAAREIAEQTHTLWKAFYAVTPNVHGSVAGGKVIGRTADGSPIIEIPLETFRVAPPPPTPAAAPTQTASGATAANAGTSISDYANDPFSPYNPNSPYNPYNPYGVAFSSGNPNADSNNPFAPIISQNGYGNGYGPYGGNNPNGGPYLGPINAGNGLTFMGGESYGPPMQVP
jgi:hypothetical protein